MRGVLATIAGILLLGLIAIFGQIIANSRLESHQTAIFQFFTSQSATFKMPDTLKWEAQKRVALYQSLMEAEQLDEGMIVNRLASGESADRCDSLLFSSLRYVALKKLHMIKEAQIAWDAIAKSQEDGHWLRHPQCRETTSRDMLLGVLAAFTQDPPHFRNHVIDLLRYVHANNGYLSEGRFDVSYLLPGVAEILRVYARGNQIAEYTLPATVFFGFSTIEFAAILPQPGYRSHLTALSTWIELELQDHPRYAPHSYKLRSAVNELSAAFDPFTYSRLRQQRLSWIAGKLFQQDPQNLFFKWLRLRTAQALTPLTRTIMLQELINMEQFPTNHLPRNCDRKADYLWQRDSSEYKSVTENCSKQFGGVDFMWMTALLLDPSHDSPVTSEVKTSNEPTLP